MTPKHTADHELPISYGHSSSGATLEAYDNVMVKCGQCNGYFRPDHGWADRYFGAQKKDLIGRYKSGRMNADQCERESQAIDKTERKVREFIDRTSDGH